MAKLRAIYPGTFDPITNGHVDIIARATQLFDEVIVAVAQSHRKTPCLPYQQRLTLTAQVFQEVEMVKVVALEGLLVTFAEQHQAKFILRGLRAVSDFDYEFQLAGMNRQLDASIETLFLPATEKHSHVSATMVREINELGGDVSLFVPSIVVEHLLAQRS